MSRNQRYYSYRLRLEKLKHKTWVLIALVRLLVFLAAMLSYLGQS